eukprot:SAG31_NODE_643_length_13291_cov_6.294042_1_plen_442_part_00
MEPEPERPAAGTPAKAAEFSFDVKRAAKSQDRAEATIKRIQATLDRLARERAEKIAKEREWIMGVPLEDRRSVFPGSYGVCGGDTRDLRGLAMKFARGEIKKVVVLAGAGMSVSAGIPDFRSPDGLYALLGQQRPELKKDPASVFYMGRFKKDPETTNAVLRAMVPDGSFRPTPAHYFVEMLHERGLLQRLYTQNIDALEKAAGLPNDKVTYVHGGFHAARCTEHGHCSERFSSLGIDKGFGIQCKEQYSLEDWLAAVDNPAPGKAAGVPRCTACMGPRGADGRRTVCGGLIKPDIVFFGQQVQLSVLKMHDDMKEADLIIVLGTSLSVHPFNQLITLAGATVPRVLINREQVGGAPDVQNGFAWEIPDLVYRDVFLQGDCDAVVADMCKAVDAEAVQHATLGDSWAEHLSRLVSEGPTGNAWEMLLAEQPSDMRSLRVKR